MKRAAFLIAFGVATMVGGGHVSASGIPVIDDGLSPSEVLVIAVAALTAFGAVWAVPNAAPAPVEGEYEGRHRDG